jgi:hypothetical protein
MLRIFTAILVLQCTFNLITYSVRYPVLDIIYIQHINMKWYHGLPSCKFVFALCFVWYLMMLSISKIIQQINGCINVYWASGEWQRQGKLEYAEKNLLQCHLSNQNPPQTRPDWMQAGAVINCLIHGMECFCIHKSYHQWTTYYIQKYLHILSPNL